METGRDGNGQRWGCGCQGALRGGLAWDFGGMETQGESFGGFATSFGGLTRHVSGACCYVRSMMAIAEAQPFGSSDADPIGKLIRQGSHRDAVAMCAREYGASLGRLCMALLGSQAEA